MRLSTQLGEVRNFFQVDDLPTFMLRELTLALAISEQQDGEEYLLLHIGEVAVCWRFSVDSGLFEFEMCVNIKCAARTMMPPNGRTRPRQPRCAGPPQAPLGCLILSHWSLLFFPISFFYFFLFANNQQKKKTCPSKRCGEQLEVEQGHLLFEPVDERLAFAQ
jgi:hypothetical protein